MRVMELDVQPKFEPSEEPWTSDRFKQYRSSPGGTVEVRLVLSGRHDEIPLGGSLSGLTSWLIQALQTASLPQEATGSSEFSEPREPIIAVSLRPALDGVPSASFAMKPGATMDIPFECVAIAPSSGELVHIKVDMEVRASIQ